MERIEMHPIGTIHSPYKEPIDIPIQGIFRKEAEAWLELKDEYSRGLKDLDGFSHAILIYFFHRSEKEEVLGKPFLEQKTHGIFAIRSPHRPNHIGLSVVKIKKISRNRMFFTEVDVLDGTPLLDIKPYVPEFDAHPSSKAGWLDEQREDRKLADGRFHDPE